jgi:MFS transporter, DHA2 family, multidrug resistance protein
MSNPKQSDAVRTSSVNPWFIAVTVTLATFMELLDTSIANVALPYIGGGLGRGYDEVTWILTTYLVANAVILPMSAWLSRVFGRKIYYLGRVALFTLTSFFCGLASTLEVMLLSRILQGLSGGGLAPVAQAILVDTFPPAKRAAAFALRLRWIAAKSMTGSAARSFRGCLRLRRSAGLRRSFGSCGQRSQSSTFDY